MRKTVSILTAACMLITVLFYTGSSMTVLGAYNDIDFEGAQTIKCGTIYEVTIENKGDYFLASFTAPEDGYYLFEALGGYEYQSLYGSSCYEPIAALYDSDKNEVQYVEFDDYDTTVREDAPYAKMVQKMKKGEIYYYKTSLLNPDKVGKYFIRAMKSPDLVFTYSSEDEYIGYYELYRYTGSVKELTLEKRYTVSSEESLYTHDNVILNGIGLGAFEGNEYLENVTMPYDFNYIASEAFLNCKNLNTINLSRNIYTIGYRAFAGCESLKSVTIKSYDVILESQCLGYDENGNKYSDFTIICNKGSTAEHYAEENGINYTLIGVEPPTDNSSDNTNTNTSDSSNSTNSSNSNTSNTTEPTSATPYKNTSASISSVSPSKGNKVVKPKVKQAKIKRITKTSKKRRLKVKWKKISGVSGYKIKCGLNRKMKKGKKIFFVKANRNSKIIKGLKSNRVYYIKVRAYKKYVSAKGKVLRAYGKWSSVKKLRTK